MAVATERPAGWIFEPIPQHRCILPTKREIDQKIVGSIWRCGACGREYEVQAQHDQRENSRTTKVLVEAT